MDAPEQEPARPRPPRSPLTAPGGAAIALVAVLAAILLVALLAGVFRERPAPIVRELGVTLEDVASRPQLYLGRRVIVSGDVRDVLSPNAFTIGPARLIVVTPEAITTMDGGLPADAIVESVAQVDGRVTVFNLAAIERELGVILDAELFPGDLEGRPALLARSVIFNPTFTEPALATATAAVVEAEAPLRAPDVLSVADVRANFEHLEGQRVTVAGEVSQGFARHVALFEGLLYDTESVLLVTGRVAPGAFPVSVPARVTGTIRALDVPTLERELGLDLDDDALRTYRGEPVIVIESILYVLTRRGAAGPILDIAGERVIVRSEVDDVFGPGVFTIDGGEVLVLARGKSDQPLDEAVVVLQGTAGVFRAAEADAISGIDLSALLEPEEWEGHPMVIADAIEVIR